MEKRTDERNTIEEFKQKLLENLPKRKINLDLLSRLQGDTLRSFRDFYKTNSENHNDIFTDIQTFFSKNEHFKDLLIDLFKDPIEYDCSLLRTAIKDLKADEDNVDLLIEILATRSPEEIRKIKKKYSEIYPSKTLLEEIRKTTSGYFRDLLESLLETKINEGDYYTDYEIEDWAYELANDDYKFWGNKDNLFLGIFTKTNSNDFKKINLCLKKYWKISIFDEIKKNYSSEIMKLFEAIFIAKTDPSFFFAKKLIQVFDEVTINYYLLNRIIVTWRNKGEKKMKKIKLYYDKIMEEDFFIDVEVYTEKGYYNMIYLLFKRDTFEHCKNYIL